MSENINIEFEAVNLEKLPLFIKKLQESFTIAVEEKFGMSEPIPSENDIRSSFHSKGAETYHLVFNKQRIGGLVLTINEETQHNSLDLFFISPEHHGHGLGLIAWNAIEKKYPNTLVWETITPYFEERNIHFYVNKCGFRIVEFFNKYHINPNMPCSKNLSDESTEEPDTSFRFEKIMK